MSKRYPPRGDSARATLSHPGALSALWRRRVDVNLTVNADGYGAQAFLSAITFCQTAEAGRSDRFHRRYAVIRLCHCPAGERQLTRVFKAALTDPCRDAAASTLANPPSRWTLRRGQLAGCKASMTLPSTESASRVPSASPFSKSAPSWPMVLVTCARQRTATSVERAKA